MNEFTHRPTEVSNLPLLLISLVPGFETSAEYQNLRPYEVDIPGVVCGAFAKYVTRLFIEMEEGQNVPLQSALVIIESLSGSSDPGVVDLVLTEILEDMDLNREQMNILRSLSGQRTKELIDRCLDFRY
jgi:hypothetical protein